MLRRYVCMYLNETALLRKCTLQEDTLKKIQALHDAAAVVGNDTVAKASAVQELVDSGTLEYAVAAARQLRTSRKALQQLLAQVGAAVPAEPVSSEQPAVDGTTEADKLAALRRMTRHSCAHIALLVAAALAHMRVTDQLAKAAACRDCLAQVHASLVAQLEPPPMLSFE